MATKKPEEKTAAKPAAEKKPSAAALKAALAQLEEQEAGKRKNTVIHRILAFVCWALAACAMYLPDIGLNLPFGAVRVLFLDPNNWVPVIIDIIVAGVLCVVAARLWIYANHIHPTKSHSPFIQFVWNQLGVIMAGIIFAPLAVILILNRKDLPQKTKTIVAAVLALVFIGTSAGSADYHPVTQDQVDSVVQQLTEEAEGYGFTDGDGVRWTKYGNCYHIFSDCQSIKRSDPENCTDGTIEEAIEANRARLCTFCIKRYAEAQENGEQLSKIVLPAANNG